MRKIAVLSLIIILCINIISCKESTQSSQIPSKTSDQVQKSSMAQETVEASPTTTVTANLVDIEIPKIDTKDNDYNNHSGCKIYEDDDNIYLLITTDLIMYTKKDKKTKLISLNCNNFVYNNGTLYFTYFDEKFYIKSYNIKTDSYKVIKILPNDIAEIAVYGNKLYFTYNYREDFEAYKLYSIGLDGKGMKEIKLSKTVGRFCLYKNYYIYAYDCDMPPIFKETIHGNSEVLIEGTYDGVFEIKNDILYFCDDDFRTIKYYDLSSGKITIIDNYTSGDFALLGQYVIYTTLINEKEYLLAYDINTRDKYYLLELLDNEDYRVMHTTRDNVYISWTMEDGSYRVYKLIIENGKASLESIVTTNNEVINK